MSAFSNNAFSVAAFSESAFDFGTGPVVVSATPSGGWWPDYDSIRRARIKKRRELEEAEAEEARIQDERDREIARLLHEQEAKDAERADLERLQRLADRFAGQLPDLPKPVRLAVLNAQDARTKSSLQQMRRVVEQMIEEEDLALQMAILLVLD